MKEAFKISQIEYFYALDYLSSGKMIAVPLKYPLKSIMREWRNWQTRWT
jgi:hypothetical protein